MNGNMPALKRPPALQGHLIGVYRADGKEFSPRNFLGYIENCPGFGVGDRLTLPDGSRTAEIKSFESGFAVGNHGICPLEDRAGNRYYLFAYKPKTR